MRHTTIRMSVRLVALVSMMALLFAFSTTAPVSAASTKITGATTSSARTTTAVPTNVNIKATPEKNADYGPNGALYDSCSGNACYNYDDEGYRTFHFDGNNQVQWSEYTYWGE